MARPKGSPKLGGRQKGTPNKTTATMKTAIMSVYERLQAGTGDPHGHFLKWAEDTPTEFYKLASKLLPIQLAGDEENPLTVVGRIELVPGKPDATR